jgi:PTS system galactitol-specific IIA component
MTQNIIAEDRIYIAPVIPSPDAAGIINFLSERLMEQGYVDSTYAKATIERENLYPTGLPTLPYAIALPHADNEGVIETAIALAILREPLKFRAMDSPERFLDVRLVMLLAVADNSYQVPMLQWISNFVQDQKIVASLVNAQTTHEVKKILDPLVEII